MQHGIHTVGRTTGAPTPLKRQRDAATFFALCQQESSPPICFLRNLKA